MSAPEIKEMKPTKIVLVDFGVPFGGAEVYLTSLVQLLKDRVDLYALCVNAELAASLRKENITVFEFPFALQRGKLIQILVGAVMLPWLRVRYGVKTVWINGYTEIVLLPIARLLGCTALATRHLSMDPPQQGWHLAPGRNIPRLLYENLAFAANKIICVSEAVARDMRALVDNSKVAVIPNWVPALPKGVEVAGSPGAKLELLFVGRLQRYKGASLIIEAMRQLDAAGHGGRVALTIVGDGECRPELENQATGLDVRFEGFQKDPSRYYRQADVFINPSVGPEGLPLVSLEAMSYGLPCVFSDLPVHREITGEGRSALLFRSKDASDLSVKIEQLLHSVDMRREFGEQGREAIKARHSPESAQERYLHELGLLT